MKEYRYIDSHAAELEGGRPLAPGDYTGPINERAPGNKVLIDAGSLIPVPDGTNARVASLNAAAERKGESLTEEEWNLDNKKLDTISKEGVS
jgi:hypothetical protein